MTIRLVANRISGQWHTHRAARAEYKKKTLLIANHWDGSVQQFYHFMLGYLLPLSSWIQRHPTQPIMVRDCGPMNLWFQALKDSVDLETISPGGALHYVIGNRVKYEILQGLDQPLRFDSRKLRTGAAALAELLDVPQSTIGAPGKPAITLIDRQSSEAFYHSPESETHMSGSERRSIPNLRSIHWEQYTRLSVRVADFARLDPRAQITRMRDSNILIGQHGAGLLHMIWMKPGSVVVEIEPPLPAEARGIFRRLAECLGHRYENIPQKSVHADVDPGEVSEILRKMGAETWG